MKFPARFATFFIALAACAVAVAGQAADNSSPINPRGDRDERPRSTVEMLQKLQVERSKKEFKEMLDRGDQALKLTEELETTVTHTGKLTRKELEKVASVEKLVKKIRSELGGGDDKDKDTSNEHQSISAIDAVKKLRGATVELIEQLKKTSRFSISAAAIHSSNAVLRFARFIRLTD